MPIPSPSGNESKNDFMNRCMGMMADNDPNMSSDQRAAMCFGKWKEHMKHKQANNDWRHFNYAVPIEESLIQEQAGSKDFIIKGVAINETTTRNGTTFTAEELSKSAHSLRNKPILKDHDAKVDSIVGVTTVNTHYDASGKRIVFEGKIIDDSIKEKIAQGLIRSVSVGAFVKDVEEIEQDGTHSTLVKGIEFVELSLVAVPADPNAGFSYAITQSLELKKQSEDISEQSNKEDKLMVQEKTEDMSRLESELKTMREASEQQLKELQTMKEEKLSELRGEYIHLATEMGIDINTESAKQLDSAALKVCIENLRNVKKKAEMQTVEVKEMKQEETKIVEASNDLKSTQGIVAPVVETSKHDFSPYMIEKAAGGIDLWRTAESIGGNFAREKNYPWEQQSGMKKKKSRKEE